MLYFFFCARLISLSILSSKLTRLLTNGKICPLVKAEWWSILFMFIGHMLLDFPSLMNAQVVSILAFENQAAMSIGCRCLFKILISLPLAVYPCVGLLDCLLVLFVVLQEPPYCFYKGCSHFISTDMFGNSLFSSVSPTLMLNLLSFFQKPLWARHLA